VTLQDLAYVTDNLDKKPVDPPQEPLEYCPIRHRTGIERLLQVIEGKDPRLDSAPKVWTLVTLAKYFGCAKVVVSFSLISCDLLLLVFPTIPLTRFTGGLCSFLAIGRTEH
jgi:hypothetical protein